MGRRRSNSRDGIEQDFLDALERLKAGRPQHSDLRDKVKKGKGIKINISTVAKEAGRARGLIASENCRYPRVRQLVLIEAGGANAEPRNRDDAIASLRAQVADLRAQVSELKGHAAYHFDLRKKAERRAFDYEARYQRLLKNSDSYHKSDDLNVFSFLRNEKEEH